MQAFWGGGVVERASQRGRKFEGRFASWGAALRSNARAGRRDPGRGSSLLRDIADIGSSARIEARDVAIVVAHPDDETIGCGATLSRLADAALMLVTDGSPLAGADAQRAGFLSPADYRAARAQELRAALAIAGVDSCRLVEFKIADQGVCSALAPLARRLASFFDERGIAVVLTHAFEGGHPDHDGVAFCVHAAAALLGARAPAVIEMPFYHLGEDGATMVAQRFCDGDDEVVVDLPACYRQSKSAMMRAHASQEPTLRSFGCESERYRFARKYDFHTLPNEGRIFYSTFDSGFAPQNWPRAAQEALVALGLRRSLRKLFSFA